MLVAFSVTPLGVGEADAEYVADAVRIVRDSGLPNRTDAMFTTVEGDWDEVMDVVKRAVEAVAAKAPRVSLTLKADIRPGSPGRWSPRSRPWSAISAPEMPPRCGTCRPAHTGLCGWRQSPSSRAAADNHASPRQPRPQPHGPGPPERQGPRSRPPYRLQTSHARRSESAAASGYPTDRITVSVEKIRENAHRSRRGEIPGHGPYHPRPGR